jgi:hypothetical protein
MELLFKKKRYMELQHKASNQFSKEGMRTFLRPVVFEDATTQRFDGK